MSLGTPAKQNTGIKKLLAGFGFRVSLGMKVKLKKTLPVQDLAVAGCKQVGDSISDRPIFNP